EAVVEVGSEAKGGIEVIEGLASKGGTGLPAPAVEAEPDGRGLVVPRADRAARVFEVRQQPPVYGLAGFLADKPPANVVLGAPRTALVVEAAEGALVDERHLGEGLRLGDRRHDQHPGREDPPPVAENADGLLHAADSERHVERR